MNAIGAEKAARCRARGFPYLLSCRWSAPRTRSHRKNVDGRWENVRRLSPAVLLTLSGMLSAQQATATAGQPYTFHVYADLVQVPALVLNTLHGSYRGLDRESFFMSLDSGPPFHPRHVRLEGDDPLNLAVLMDVSGGEAKRLSDGLANAVSHLPTDLFGPSDHASVFAFDCTLVRSIIDAPASLPTIQSGIRVVLETPSLHAGTDGQGRCGRHLQLWDAIGGVAHELRNLPGRRVLLVLSDGHDRGSKNSWEAVRRYAAGFGITIFGLGPPVNPVNFLTSGIRSNGQIIIDFEDPFGLLCGGTGGLSLVSSQMTLEPMIRRVVGFLRSRYILDFPRPSNEAAGLHNVSVAIADRSALIRTSGVTVPLQDKAILNDPSTVPSDPGKAPVMGTRRILTQPK